MTYATPADLIQRYDSQVIGDLLEDGGGTVPVEQFAGNAVLLTALDDGASEIELALKTSERYTSDELAALSAVSQNYLRKLNCELAVATLLQRRDSLSEGETRRVEQARLQLADLRKGNVALETELRKEIQAGRADAVQLVREDTLNSPLLRYNVKNYFPARRFPR